MLTPEARNRAKTAKRLAHAAKNKPPTHPDAVRFLQKCTGDVSWLCDRLEKADAGQHDEETDCLREDHEALKSTLLSVCARLDVDKIDDILPAIAKLQLQATEPDEIEEDGYVEVAVIPEEDDFDEDDEEDEEDDD